MSLTVHHHCNEVSTTVKWKFEDFSTKASRNDLNSGFTSRLFSLYKSRLSFYLLFEPTNKREKSDKTYSSLYLVNENLDNENEVQLKWKFWIENEDGKKIGDQEEMTHKFNTLSKGWGNAVFVKHSELYPPSDFVKNDFVYICCEVTPNSSQEGFKKIPLNDVEILRYIYESKEDDNLSIRVKKRKLSINKSLLTFRSDVFEQMLENENFAESKNGEIKIDDFEEKVVKAFHEFMHLGYVTEENVDYAHELLKMSDKYNVKELKEECTQILGKTLNKDNILPLMITAFTHDCLDFQKLVLNHVTKNDSDTNFKSIMKTEEWKEFALKNGRVSDEIIDAVFAKVKFV